jgi:hypothetical protein
MLWARRVLSIIGKCFLEILLSHCSLVRYLAYQSNLPFSNYGIFFISETLSQIGYCVVLRSDWRQYITPNANLTFPYGDSVSQEPHGASPEAGESEVTSTFSVWGRTPLRYFMIAFRSFIERLIPN